MTVALLFAEHEKEDHSDDCRRDEPDQKVVHIRVSFVAITHRLSSTLNRLALLNTLNGRREEDVEHEKAERSKPDEIRG